MRPSHLVPRTREGRIATVAFLFFMAMAQPPIVHGFANRLEPWILGTPFLYAWLFAAYVGMIVVLIWTFRRGI